MKTLYFVVHYDPDLVEGKGHKRKGVIKVTANDKHGMFARHWCYNEFGNEIDFIMGNYSSVTVVKNWYLEPDTKRGAEKFELLADLREGGRVVPFLNPEKPYYRNSRLSTNGG